MKLHIILVAAAFLIFVTAITDTSFVAAADNFGYNYLDPPETADITITINESVLNVNNSDYLDGFDSSDFIRKHDDYLLRDSGNWMSIQWNSRSMYDGSEVLSLDYGGRYGYDNAGVKTFDWDFGNLYDGSGSGSMDWFNRVLKDSSAVDSINYENKILYGQESSVSVDWNGKVLRDNSGGIVLNWSDGVKVNGVKMDCPTYFPDDNETGMFWCFNNSVVVHNYNSSIEIYYTFDNWIDDDVYDETDNDRDGQNISGAYQNLSGLFGSALTSPAAGSRVDYATITSGELSSGTIVWYQYMNQAFNSGTNRQIWILSVGAGNQLSCQVYTNNNWYCGHVNAGDGRLIFAASTTNYKQGEWASYVYSWNTTGDDFYVNGVRTNGGAAANRFGGTATIRVGDYTTGTLSAHLDDFLIFNKKLSLTEVIALNDTEPRSLIWVNDTEVTDTIKHYGYDGTQWNAFY